MGKDTKVYDNKWEDENRKDGWEGSACKCDRVSQMVEINLN